MHIITINQYEKESNEKYIENCPETLERAEQNGVASIVSLLREIRLDNMLEQMEIIDYRQKNAMEELKLMTLSVDEIIKSNRGGDKGLHGFLGERAQVFLNNAWSILNGNVRIDELIDDNGMTDYLERGIEVQQKACRSNGKLGLDHVLKHKAKYPMFNGKYQIPRDFFEEYKRIGETGLKEAGRLSRNDRKIWIEIQKIKEAGITVEPMIVNYEDIQRDKIAKTIETHRNRINKKAEMQRRIAVKNNSPTIKTCVKTALASSAVEGVVSGFVTMIKKKRGVESLKDLNKEDLKDIGLSTAEGAVKGAVRGTAIYLAENYTPISGIVASSAVTIAFESGRLLTQRSKGELSIKECSEEIGKVTFIIASGAVGAKVGKKICPVPVVGEIAGGAIVTMIAEKTYNNLCCKTQSGA